MSLSARENKDPLQIYVVGFEVFIGLILSVAIVLSAEEEVNTVPGSGTLLAAVHVAIGEPVRPVNNSYVTQVRLNTEPATKLPEVVIFTAIDGDGTTKK